MATHHADPAVFSLLELIALSAFQLVFNLPLAYVLVRAFSR